MGEVTKLRRKERRRHSQRICWIASPYPGVCEGSFKNAERRTDPDGAKCAAELSRMLANGTAAGLVFGVIKSDGRVEMGCTGTLFDNSLLAGGLTSKLGALVDSWREHPSMFLPEPDLPADH